MDTLAIQYRTSVIGSKTRYLAKGRRAPALQAAVLDEILAANRQSAFGKEHGFATVHSPEAYARRVSVRSYQDLYPWIEREASGIRSTLTTDPPIVFHRTSSTTGTAKKIPLTKSGAYLSFANIGAHRAALLEHHPEVVETVDATLALTVSPPVKTVTAGGVPWCFGSETEWGRLGMPRHPGTPGARAPWTPWPHDVDDWQYYRLVMALTSPLRAITGWFPASILHIARVLNERREQIVRDVRDGTIGGRPRRAANPLRARELEQVLGRSTEQPLCEIWPTLSVVECWKTGTSGLYLEALQRCLGADVEVFPCSYGCTESPIAFVLGRDNGALLDLTCAYFEFVPVSSSGESVALRAHQLERDSEYTIVLTTMSGLYRYALGDVVRVQDFVGDIPIIEYQCRHNVVASLIAEKITEPQIVAALSRLMHEGEVGSFEASLCPMYSAVPHYVLAIDGPAHVDYATRSRLSTLLDNSLRENINYAFHRTSGLVDPARIEVLAPGTFRVRRAAAQQCCGASLPQQKHRVVIDRQELDQLRYTSSQIRADAHSVK